MHDDDLRKSFDLNGKKSNAMHTTVGHTLIWADGRLTREGQKGYSRGAT